jgi:copper chaperone
MAMERTVIELKLPTMTCGHCVRTVTKTVQAVDADAKLEIDLPTQRVRVESRRDRQEFVKALSDEGYAPAA